MSIPSEETLHQDVLRTIIKQIIPNNFDKYKGYNAYILQQVEKRLKKEIIRLDSKATSHLEIIYHLKAQFNAMFHSEKVLYETGQVLPEKGKIDFGYSDSEDEEHDRNNEILNKPLVGQTTKNKGKESVNQMGKQRSISKTNSQREWFEKLAKYKENEELVDQIQGLEIRGKNFLVSNDGSCPKCKHCGNLFVVLDFLFPAGDMPEIVQHLITVGKAVLWSSKEQQAKCKDPPTFLCTGKCPSDCKRNGFNINWKKTDLEKIYLFPEKNYKEIKSAVEKKNVKIKEIFQENIKLNDSKSSSNILTDTTFDLRDIIPENTMEHIASAGSDDDVEESISNVYDVGDGDDVDDKDFAYGDDDDGNDDGFDDDGVDDDGNDDGFDDDDDDDDVDDVGNDYDYTGDERSDSEEYDEGHIDISYYRSHVAWVVLDECTEENDDMPEKEDQIIRTMLALEDARVDFENGKMKIHDSRESVDVADPSKQESTSSFLTSPSKNAFTIENTTTAGSAALDILKRQSKKENNADPISSSLSYQTPTHILKGAKIYGETSETVQKPAFTAADFPISTNGSCPYCHSVDVIYIILQDGDQVKAEELPPLLQKLLNADKAKKMKRGAYDLPSFQCKTCTYGFNLDWNKTSLENIYFNKKPETATSLTTTASVSKNSATLSNYSSVESTISIQSDHNNLPWSSNLSNQQMLNVGNFQNYYNQQSFIPPLLPFGFLPPPWMGFSMFPTLSGFVPPFGSIPSYNWTNQAMPTSFNGTNLDDTNTSESNDAPITATSAAGAITENRNDHADTDDKTEEYVTHHSLEDTRPPGVTDSDEITVDETIQNAHTVLDVHDFTVKDNTVESTVDHSQVNSFAECKLAVSNVEHVPGDSFTECESTIPDVCAPVSSFSKCKPVVSAAVHIQVNSYAECELEKAPIKANCDITNKQIPYIGSTEKNELTATNSDFINKSFIQSNSLKRPIADDDESREDQLNEKVTNIKKIKMNEIYLKNNALIPDVKMEDIVSLLPSLSIPVSENYKTNVDSSFKSLLVNVVSNTTPQSNEIIDQVSCD